jgi:hypothetical protein
MLLSLHAIGGSASAPTAEYQRRDHAWRVIAGTQNRQFIDALVEALSPLSDLFLHLVALAWPKD